MDLYMHVLIIKVYVVYCMTKQIIPAPELL